MDKLLLNGIEQTVFGSIAELLGPSRALSGSTPLGLEADRWVHDHLYSRSASIYGARRRSSATSSPSDF